MAEEVQPQQQPTTAVNAQAITPVASAEVQSAIVESGAPAGAQPLAEHLLDELAARVQWVREQIAEYMYRPGLPPERWPGRDDLVNECAKHFGLEAQEAGQSVDHAVVELWAIDKPDDVTVQKQLSAERIRALVQLTRAAMRDGRKETTYQYEKDSKDPNRVLATPVKEKRFSGIEMAQVRMLLELEVTWQNLWGLQGKQGGATNLMDKIFGEFDKRMVSEERRKSSGSKAGQMREKGFEQLGEAGQARITAAILQLETGAVAGAEAAPRAKRIKAKVSKKKGGGAPASSEEG